MEWFKILPPLVAVAIVLWKKEVILALILSIFVSEWLLFQGDLVSSPIFGGLNSLERITSVFTDPGNTRILIFSVMVGALFSLYEKVWRCHWISQVPYFQRFGKIASTSIING